MFAPDAHIPKLNRSMVYLGACMIASIGLAREKQVNVRCDRLNTSSRTPSISLGKYTVGSSEVLMTNPSFIVVERRVVTLEGCSASTVKLPPAKADVRAAIIDFNRDRLSMPGV
jgi:hypothetical protein